MTRGQLEMAMKQLALDLNSMADAISDPVPDDQDPIYTFGFEGRARAISAQVDVHNKAVRTAATLFDLINSR